MTRVVVCASLLLAIGALVQGSEAAALFRCGGGIVGPSDATERVAELCGEPDEQVERDVVRRHSVRACNGSGWTVVTSVVHVETWTYDFGPRRLTQELIFENGSLVRVRSRGYGTGRQRDPDAARWSNRRWVVMPQVAARLRRRD